MRYSKIIILMLAVLTLLTLSGVHALGQTVTISPSGPLYYHVFLAGDLGLRGGGRGNRDFTITFGAGAGADQYITVEVLDIDNNVLLVSGVTDTFPQSTLAGTYFIGELDDEFGGDFTINDQAEKLYDKLLATGGLPRGTFRITVGLNPSGAFDTLEVHIIPPYFQPLYPVDVQTKRDVLKFRWTTNLRNQELHVYSDAAGRREKLRGSDIRLPYLRIPDSGALITNPQPREASGSNIAPLLEDGQKYYWQIHGDIVTSHGRERMKSVLSAFEYYEELEKAGYIGLSDSEKAEIMDKLIELLIAVMGREEGEIAAQRLSQYEVNRIIKDNSPLSSAELIGELNGMIAGDATVTGLRFQ